MRLRSAMHANTNRDTELFVQPVSDLRRIDSVESEKDHTGFPFRIAWAVEREALDPCKAVH